MVFAHFVRGLQTSHNAVHRAVDASRGAMMAASRRRGSRSAPPQASRHIPAPERLKLWVRAGGRCTVCNKYLVEDEFTQQPVNLGELAHNVGRVMSRGSPRGEDALELALRNDAENLLLLCGDHHHVIDDRVVRGDYTVDGLKRMKARHEDRIKRLTAMGEDSETVVIRIIGRVRGAAVELDARTVRAAVVEHSGRYPHYGLNFRGADVEVDLRNLPGEGTELYWATGQQAIDEALGQPLITAVERGEVRHLSVFGLARIPLLAYAGLRLDDKVPVEIYQRHRGSESWEWEEAAPAVEFEHVCLRAGHSPDRAALVLSISGTINLDELPDEIPDDASLWAIAPVDVTPNRDVMSSPASLQSFALTYRNFLSMMEAHAPGVGTLDVFAAVPVAAAVTLGRELMRDVHPALRLYDRNDNGSYVFSLELTP